MMRENKLIEQVRALAEAVEKRERFSDNWLKAHVVNFDFPALLVALERAERIEQRAHTLVVMLSVTDLPFQIDERVDALVVALSEPQ